MPTVAGNDDEDSIQEIPTNKRKAPGNPSGRGVKVRSISLFYPHIFY